MENTVQTSAVDSNVDNFSASYARVAPAIEALNPEEAMHINLDISTVATQVFGCLPGVRALRDELVRMPDFDPKVLEELDDYAGALLYAQAVFVQATLPPGSLEKLVPEGVTLRDQLLADAQAAVKRGLMPEAAIRGVRRATGHRPLMMDLTVLVHAMRAAWPVLEGRTGATAEDVARAEALAASIGAAVGLRDHVPETAGKAAQLRSAAYTLLLRQYEELRTAVQYVRRKHRDADDIMPSLFSTKVGARKRSAGGKSGDAPEAETPAPSTAAEPAPVTATHALPDLNAQLEHATFSR